jgi:hypothetical protein
MHSEMNVLHGDEGSYKVLTVSEILKELAIPGENFNRKNYIGEKLD